MKFGPVPVASALGAVAAHTVAAEGRTIRKGTVLDAHDVDALAKAGLAEIVVARLEPDDVAEDEAARRLAAAVAGSQVRADAPFTGRVNLFAERAGVLRLDADAVRGINAVDEAMTLATLAPFAAVEAGRMVATVKIIPFAVPGALVDAAIAAARSARLDVVPYVRRKIGFVQTVTASLPTKALDKTARVTRARVAALNAELLPEHRVPHEVEALTHAVANARAQGAELILIFGASAIADRRDVIPAALERAGGRVLHLGMPVDPGNLLLVGELEGAPVLGAPGCARSPKENGFDWVLARLAAGLLVTREDIVGMGVGGLLMEIAARPQPRAEKPTPPHRPRVAGVLLAAGRSTRFGGPNKLLQDLDGKPVVRHAAEALLSGGCAPVLVVTGHMREEIERALAGIPVTFVHNPDFAAGLSTSLAAGIGAAPPEADGALVALGDMPRVTADDVAALLAAFDPEKGRAIVAPTVGGKRGNPVLWARRFFAELRAVEGDVGARHLVGANENLLAEIALDGDGALVDVDTPEALAAARAKKSPRG